MKIPPLLMLIIIPMFTLFAQKDIVFSPIGIFHSPYTTETGAPRQGILVPERKGTIEVYKQYAEGLKDLHFFEYIIVLYHFNLVKDWKPTVTPPSSAHNFGVFSTRSPKRPNPIGFSIVKLEKTEGNILYVSGIDAFDQTPVLDIKPYLPSVDAIKSAQNELIEKELGHHDEKFISDSTFYK